MNRSTGAAVAALWQEDYARADSILQQAVALHPEPLEFALA